MRRRPTDLARALEEAEFWHDHCVPRHAAMILRPALQPYAPAGRCADRQVIRAAVLFAATAFDTPDSQLAYALFAERNSRCELGAQDPLTLSAMTTLAEVTVQQNRSGEAITVCGSIIEAHCARGDLPAALTWRRARAGLLHGTGRCGYAQDEIAVCLELAGTLPTAADRQTAARQALIWRTVILAVCGDASAALAVLREHSALLPPVGSRERRTDEATIAGAIHARTTVHPAVCTRPGDSQPFTQHPLAFWTTAVRTAVQS